MSSPSHTLIHPRLEANLLGFLPNRVTLESPRQGGGWNTPVEAEHVPSLLVDDITYTADPRTGGLLRVQRTTLTVLASTTIGTGWRVTDEANGRQYKTGTPTLNGPGPLVDVLLEAGH